MGFQTARILAAEGAFVTIIGHDPDHATAQASKLRNEFGVGVLGLAADCRIPSEIEKAITKSIDSMGRPVGLLTSNGATDRNGDLMHMSDDDWLHGFQDVLMGQIRAIRAVLPAMIEAGGGRIVTTAAYSARAPKPTLFGYSAMKAALVNLTKNLAKTYGSQGIRANCICPGATATDRFAERLADVMASHGLEREEAEQYIMREVFKMPTALGRPGSADEVAEIMAVALSARGGYMTGAVINVDGGTDF